MLNADGGILLRVITLLLPVIALSGCFGRSGRIKQPKIDPDSAVRRALTTYDQDGDGKIQGNELSASPTLPYFDANGDGRVEEDELRKMVATWTQSRLGLTEILALVTYQGRPLASATVTLQPDPLLGDAISPATGVTDDQGVVAISIPAEELPHPNVRGCRLGVYRVLVSKLQDGKETLPTQYNVETKLGCHVAPGMDPMLKFDL